MIFSKSHWSKTSETWYSPRCNIFETGFSGIKVVNWNNEIQRGTAVALQVCRSSVAVYPTHGKHCPDAGVQSASVVPARGATRNVPALSCTLSQLFCQL